MSTTFRVNEQNSLLLQVKTPLRIHNLDTTKSKGSTKTNKSENRRSPAIIAKIKPKNGTPASATSRKSNKTPKINSIQRNVYKENID